MSKKQYAVYLCVLHLVFACLMWVVSNVPEVNEFVRETKLGRSGSEFGAPLGIVLIALPGLLGVLPYYFNIAQNTGGTSAREKIIVAGLVIFNSVICLGYTVFICYGL